MPRAFADLNGILTYIAYQSSQNARTVIDRLQASMQSLEILPTRYEVHERRADPTKTVRSMAMPPFIIYYRVDERQSTVRILTVRHGHRRQPKRFR
jgi:plasmid stabilization system protein ParE